MSETEEQSSVIEIISEQEQEYAQNALSEFKLKNYLGTQQALNKLDRSHDYKVLHNKAVAEYYKSDLKKTENFQKHLTAICNQFNMKLEKLDDVDQCIIHYNEAILLYHQRQYTAAIQIMDRVYKFIEAMEDRLGKQVILFSIELQLSIKQPDKALSFISYVENQLLNGIPNIKMLEPKVKEKEKKPPSDPATVEFRKKLVKYKLRCYLMNKDIELSSKELEVLSKDKNNYETTFLAANYEYLQGNVIEAQELLGSVPNDHYVYNEYGESSTILFYNNMGVLHHLMGKPNLACHYFQLALKEDMAVASVTNNDINEKPLYTIGGSKYHEIMYNLGISLLYSKRPAQAFECLVIAVRRYHRNARLWMRLAECCILVHKKSNEADFDLQRKQKEIIVDVIGSRDKQKVILNAQLNKDKKFNIESQSYAVPVPTIEFATLCLRNAMLLLPSDTPTAPVPLFLIPGITPPVPTSSPGPAPSSPLSPSSIINLKNSIFAASAYVGLCLGDYVSALENAEDLLKEPQISGAHRLLGHLYSAEALVFLEKIPEAIEHLNPENVKSIDLDLGGDELDKTKTTLSHKWFPQNLATAHATMQYNIAVAKTIRGQLDEAITLLKQVWQMSSKCKVPGHIIMLVLYIELKLGHTEPARNLIKQYLFQNKT